MSAYAWAWVVGLVVPFVLFLVIPLVVIVWRDTHPGEIGEIDIDLQLPHVPAWHRLIGADQADEGVPVRRLGLIDKARRQIADRNTRRPRS